MKRYQSGARVQNWRRPLAPSQIRDRFRAERYNMPGLVERGRFVSEHYTDCYYDYFYQYDFYYQQEFYRDEIDDEYGSSPKLDDMDWAYLVVQELCVEIVCESHNLFARGGYALPTSENLANDTRDSLREQTQVSSELEDRLFDHLQLMGNARFDSQLLLHCLRQQGLDKRDVAVALTRKRFVDLRGIYNSWGTERLLICFAPFWIRSPRTWNGQGGDRSLIQHLFVKYPVPEWLYAAGWLFGENHDDQDEPADQLKAIIWFILLAQGGSVRRAARHFGWNIPNGFQDRLTRVSPGSSLVEASMFTEIERLGGSEADLEVLLHQPVMWWDTTSSNAERLYVEFWYATVRWLIRYRDALSLDECHEILGWAAHEYTESEARRRPLLEWQARGPRAVLQMVEQYEQSLCRATPKLVWQRQNWDWSLPVVDGQTWEFRELSSAVALQDESLVMRHCVGSYAQRCSEGYSVIVSLRRNTKRCVTIEVDPETKRIVQARGYCNREASTEELAAIRHWVNAVLIGNATPVMV